MTLYKGDDFFYDHPVITGSFIIFIITLGITILVIGVHLCAKNEIAYQAEMRVKETEEKARICQETGYCNSKNIDIKYDGIKEMNND